MGKEWIEIKEIGQLYLEKVLVTFDFPILFVCLDYEKRRYLCLNVDDETEKSIIAPIDCNTLIKMLTDEITMEQVFRNNSSGKIIVAEYNADNNTIISHTENASEMSEELLPQKDAYFELHNDEIDDYIISLNKQFIKIDVENYYDQKTFFMPKETYISTYKTKYNNTKFHVDMVLKEAAEKNFYNITDSRMIS